MTARLQEQVIEPLDKFMYADVGKIATELDFIEREAYRRRESEVGERNAAVNRRVSITS